MTLEHGLNVNLKADLDTPMFEISHLYFQSNSSPLGKHAVYALVFYWVLFFQSILDVLALNG